MVTRDTMYRFAGTRPVQNNYKYATLFYHYMYNFRVHINFPKVVCTYFVIWRWRRIKPCNNTISTIQRSFACRSCFRNAYIITIAYFNEITGIVPPDRKFAVEKSETSFLSLLQSTRTKYFEEKKKQNILSKKKRKRKRSLV